MPRRSAEAGELLVFTRTLSYARADDLVPLLTATSLSARGEVFTDPHTLARAMVVELDHPTVGKMNTIGTPVKLASTPGAIARPAPLLGEHTEEVLAELAARKRAPLAAAEE